MNMCKEAVNTLSGEAEDRIIQRLLDIRSKWKTCCQVVGV